MRYKLLYILSLFFFIEVEAQNILDQNTEVSTFRLAVNIASRKNSKLYLGEYYKGKLIVIDSTIVDSKGKSLFELDHKLMAGQYELHTERGFQIDFLLNGQERDVLLSINEKDYSENKVSGSEDAKLYWEYIVVENRINLQKLNIQTQLNRADLSETARKSLEKKRALLDDKLNSYSKDFIQKNDKTWAGLFIKAAQPVVGLVNKISIDDPAYQNYLHEHFFDHVNLEDVRFWRTEFFAKMIDSYFEFYAKDTPQSAAKSASILVVKTRANDLSFNEMLSYLLTKTIKNRTASDEYIWVRLYEDFVLGKNHLWLNSLEESVYARNYELIKRNKIGEKAPSLQLITYDGNIINLLDVEAELLLLYFYDPDCGVCKKKTPEIYNSLFQKYRDRGLRVAAINTSSDMKKWFDFIEENKLNDWYNYMDDEPNSGLWLKYNLSGTPDNYIIDRYKVIVDKRLGLDRLDVIIDNILKK